MQTTALTYAATLEQALTAADAMDRASEPGYPWGSAAHHAVFERFGGAGEDLPYDFQNAIYEIELGYPADFVVFH